VPRIVEISDINRPTEWPMERLEEVVHGANYEPKRPRWKYGGAQGQNALNWHCYKSFKFSETLNNHS
jgi:hypothetical protein